MVKFSRREFFKRSGLSILAGICSTKALPPADQVLIDETLGNGYIESEWTKCDKCNGHGFENIYREDFFYDDYYARYSQCSNCDGIGIVLDKKIGYPIYGI